MLEVSKADIVEKLIFLENYLKHKSYKILEPFHVQPNDIIFIQNAAKIIGDFVGLHDVTFIVAASKQTENAAAHIDLDNTFTSYIELDPEVISDGNAILGVLSHEISHKYLHYHGIRKQGGKIYEMENEILTDLTSIYLGLGKLILNGCEKVTIQTSRSNDQVNTQTITNRFGYIGKEKYAFAYNLICNMRKIPADIKNSRLENDVMNIVNISQKNFASRYFDSEFHNLTKRLEIFNWIKESIEQTQESLMEIERGSLLMEKYIENQRTLLSDSHKLLMGILSSTKSSIKTEEVNPHLRFLKSLKLIDEYEGIDDKLGDKKFAIRRQSNQMNELLESLGNKNVHKLFEEYENSNKIVCYNCGFTKVVSKRIEGQSVKCPKCDYEFIYDMSFPLLEDEIIETVSTSAKPKKKGWKKLFG
ncbi:MAG: hypothetical protein ACOYN6_08005 [Ignavibacteria bacterium]